MDLPILLAAMNRTKIDPRLWMQTIMVVLHHDLICITHTVLVPARVFDLQHLRSLRSRINHAEVGLYKTPLAYTLALKGLYRSASL